MSYLKDYVEFKKGTIPLIFSVPHGGSHECHAIPNRPKGILGIDKGTIEITKILSKLISINFKKKTSTAKFPSLIFSNVPRSKIDLNRDENEAYIHGSLLAREIYNFYHGKIRELIFSNLRSNGRSLLIDIHGFETHDRPPGFRDVDLILGTSNLESFFSEPVARKDWENNIRGMIIKKFLNLNIPIAPAHPRRKEYVLSGGYITRQYGASQIPKSQAIQIEFSDKIRLHDKKLRNVVLTALAEIFFEEILEK